MRRARRLRSWAQERFEDYGRAVADLLGADSVPEIRIRVTESGPPGSTSGTDVSFSASWFVEHPDDVGCCLHEFAHAIMRAPVFDESTGWLIEGIADHVRDALGFDAPWTRPHYEPGKALAGYQTTAHFLQWLEPRCPGVIRELSKRLSAGTYSDRAFLSLCGSPLGSLVTNYETDQPAGDRAP